MTRITLSSGEALVPWWLTCLWLLSKACLCSSSLDQLVCPYPKHSYYIEMWLCCNERKTNDFSRDSQGHWTLEKHASFIENGWGLTALNWPCLLSFPCLQFLMQHNISIDSCYVTWPGMQGVKARKGQFMFKAGLSNCTDIWLTIGWIYECKAI